MRIIQATVQNFSSYKELTIDFQGRGLTLVSGSTGSGKSTLCDIVPWILFGRTAKDGAVDEVISWNSEGLTSGCIKLEAFGKIIEVVRERRPNELYYTVDGSIRRGKDLNDTQQLINNLIGLTPTSYLAGAYYHEFSETASFFTAKAKDRRALSEQLSDLSMAKKLTENIAEYKKEVKKELDAVSASATSAQRMLEHLSKSLEQLHRNSIQWELGQARQVEEVRGKLADFNVEVQKNIKALNRSKEAFAREQEDRIDALVIEAADLDSKILLDSHIANLRSELEKRKNALGDAVCSECGSKKDSHKHLLINKEEYAIQNKENENRQHKMALTRVLTELQREQDKQNPYPAMITKELVRENTYADELERVLAQVNPFTASKTSLAVEVGLAQAELDRATSEARSFKVELSDLELLTTVTNDFRATLVKNTVIQLEKSTNALLTSHFDAEIRVKFDVEEADKLDVTITKDGNVCSYTQLSKGQRCLLKLCFGVSVMKSISNHLGTDFNAIFFDEALSGLDGRLKMQAYNLFKDLSSQYESVFIVEHDPEFKAAFERQINVELVDGWSVTNEA